MEIMEKCPKCGSKDIQLMSRVTGYMSNLEGWNKGKKQELIDRYKNKGVFK